MIDCTVTSHYGAYIVTFEDGKTILLQDESDIAGFAVDTGLVKATEDWDGSIGSLGEAWDDVDMTDIEKCSEAYYDIASLEPVPDKQ